MHLALLSYEHTKIVGEDQNNVFPLNDLRPSIGYHLHRLQTHRISITAFLRCPDSHAFDFSLMYLSGQTLSYTYTQSSQLTGNNSTTERLHLQTSSHLYICSQSWKTKTERTSRTIPAEVSQLHSSSKCTFFLNKFLEEVFCSSEAHPTKDIDKHLWIVHTMFLQVVVSLCIWLRHVLYSVGYQRTVIVKQAAA